MKILLLLFTFMVLTLDSICQTSVNDNSRESYYGFSDKVDSITLKELKRGIIIDTAFMIFCFGDSPEITEKKFNSLVKSNNISVNASHTTKTYSFSKNTPLANGEWKISFRYANNLLSEVYLFIVPNLFNISHGDEPVSLTGV